ncbi:aldo/keto reductase [Enterococcus hermanniensis]|uniref:2,5-diketo-D-gluconic acid reductase n=1 Tax=Enterococcus hermanniensis TaxID=249189 RepID=A0A1L8TPQ1_9ENTE|nr:aldo/keto reductase [Enterococcus hermanniensis]OJG46257.1 2,5-diketo-D-gluconic acid reductase [Enterococcus hermanniensis]
MEMITLNNGIEMPLLGLGVLRTTADETEEMVKTALLNDYRLIDTAAGYMNEKAVGKGIKASGIPRKEIFLTSKLWITDTGYENTLKAFERTLKLLDTNYLDLWLIHQPYGDVFGSWKAMNELLDKKLIRAIGVSNFYEDQLMNLICNGGGVVPAVNQIETHIYKQNRKELEFMTQEGITMEAWSPFASGIENVFENEILMDMATKRNVSVSQIILRWLTQRGIIAIPKTTHVNRMIENINSFDFKLTDSDMEIISQLNKDHSVYPSHRDPEFIKMLSQQKLTFEV